MTTSTRPYLLPPELPDPPTPPAGHRGVYRGMGWRTTTEKLFTVTQDNGEWMSSGIPKIANGYTDRHYIEYIPLRPTPAGVADVPDGFEFYGDGAIVGVCQMDRENLACYSYGSWSQGANGDTGLPYAMRIGSALHRRMFDARPEQPATEPVKPKAREWDAWERHGIIMAGEGTLSLPLDGSLPPGSWAKLRVREILPGEQDLLEQAVVFLREFVEPSGQWPDLKIADAAAQWLSIHFPAPEPAVAPEPDENGWLPIEFAPKDGHVVLVSLPNSDIPQSARWRGRWEMAWDQMQLTGDDAPTHFQPAPKAPTPAQSHE